MGEKKRFTNFFSGKGSGPLVSLWRHFPGEDLDPVRLAKAHAAFFRAFPFDFLKVTWAAGSLGQPWGLTVEAENVDPFGVYPSQPVIECANQWAALSPQPADQGFLGEQLQGLRLLRQELGPEVPLVVTLFSPLSTAARLSGQAVYRHLEEAPEAVHTGLEAITRTFQHFAEEVRRAGADGVFFSTLSGDRRWIAASRFRIFGRPYDLRVLAAANLPSILHVHGENPLWEELLDYPTAALHWHDRRVGPSLATMRQRTEKILAGGIHDQGAIAGASPAAVEAEVWDALRQVPPSKLIVAPGCVIPTASPPDHLRTVLRIVREFRGD